MSAAVVQCVREFVVENLDWPGSPDDLAPDYLLIENEVVDSLGIFAIVTFLEDEFGIEIDDDDLVPEHFETLAAVAGLVEAKRAV